MVGGLVEEQEVGALQQQLGQLHAHLPAAAEHGEGSVEVLLVESEPCEDCRGGLFAAVPAEQGHLLGDVGNAGDEALVFGAVVVGACGRFVVEQLQLVLQLVDGGEGREGLVEHRAVAVGYHLLGQVAHRLPRRHDKGARSGLLQSGEDFEEGRLACAVFPYKAYAVLVAKVKGDVAEKCLAGELYGYVVGCNHLRFHFMSRFLAAAV